MWGLEIQTVAAKGSIWESLGRPWAGTERRSRKGLPPTPRAVPGPGLEEGR